MCLYSPSLSSMEASSVGFCLFLAFLVALSSLAATVVSSICCLLISVSSVMSSSILLGIVSCFTSSGRDERRKGTTGREYIISTSYYLFFNEGKGRKGRKEGKEGKEGSEGRRKGGRKGKKRKKESTSDHPGGGMIHHKSNEWR